MTEQFEFKNDQDAELKKQLDKVTWPIEYGSVKIQIRNGKVTLLTVERTIKVD